MQMVVLPADEEYAVELTGTGEGALELQFEEYEDGTLVAERTHTQIPVTNNLASTFTFTNVEDIGTIEIDTDGDGTNDTVLSADTETPQETLHELTTYIRTLTINRFAKAILLTRVYVVGYFFEHDKTARAQEELQSLTKVVKLYTRFHLLSGTEHNTILGYIEELK